MLLGISLKVTGDHRRKKRAKELAGKQNMFKEVVQQASAEQEPQPGGKGTEHRTSVLPGKPRVAQSLVGAKDLASEIGAKENGTSDDYEANSQHAGHQGPSGTKFQLVAGQKAREDAATGQKAREDAATGQKAREDAATGQKVREDAALCAAREDMEISADNRQP